MHDLARAPGAKVGGTTEPYDGFKRGLSVNDIHYDLTPKGDLELFASDCQRVTAPDAGANPAAHVREVQEFFNLKLGVGYNATLSRAEAGAPYFQSYRRQLRATASNGSTT